MQLALTEPQEDFVFSDAAHPAIIGGLGSGKTKAGSTRLILKMLQEPGINTAYYMPTYDLLKLRAIPYIEQDLSDMGIQYKSNRSDYIIKLIGYGDLILRSYDRPERMVSYEVAHSVMDELDTIPKDKASLVWRKASERNRQKCNGQNTMGNVTTPDQGFSGFTYSKWEKLKQPGYVSIKAPTYSNPYLPDGYIQQIRDNYDPLLAEMYIEGEYVSLSQNKVYHFFDRKRHHSGRILTDEDTVINVSIDFNIGGCCAVVFVIDDNKPIAVDEFVSHDTRDFVNNLVKYNRQHRKIIVYPDASGGNDSTNASQTDIEIISNAGYRIDCPKGNPAVRDRINAYNGLLSHDKLKINTNKCKQLTDALESQGYDKNGKPEKFNEHPSLDDWADSSGYFISRKYPVNKPVFYTGIRSAA